MVEWSFVVCFVGASVPKGRSRVSLCVGGWFLSFLCYMGTCPFFRLLNIMMHSSPVFSRKKRIRNVEFGDSK